MLDFDTLEHLIVLYSGGGGGGGGGGGDGGGDVGHGGSGEA